MARHIGRDHDLEQATHILEEMEGLDIESTLAFLRQHGGYCDCEILLNVVAGRVVQ
jgi:hypothetical protein